MINFFLFIYYCFCCLYYLVRFNKPVLKARCLKALNLLKVLSHTSWGADRTTLLKLYRPLVQSKLDYGFFSACFAFSDCSFSFCACSFCHCCFLSSFCCFLSLSFSSFFFSSSSFFIISKVAPLRAGPG